MIKKKRYAQVGLGGRHELFRDAITHSYPDNNEMVALCDTNEGRLHLSAARINEKTGLEVRQYHANNFTDMIKETKPDCVIVTTKDCFHDEYICEAMNMGCDVITEKPMTIDAKRCRRIINTAKKTGRKCTVTFNYRYSPPRTQIKDLLMSGIIGEVFSVDFHWMLDTHHGADYFRRWHRNKKNSGGLMVHKATHHFDLVNWLLGTVPQSVYASGHRRFYTPTTAENYGLKKRGIRCHKCKEITSCPFALRMEKNDSLRAMYLDAEAHDGYYRDLCVFSPEIDIEDSMNLVVNYCNGAKMSYSLNAFSPWEGHIISFNGSKGRLEHKCEETVYINADGSVPGALKTEGSWTRIFPLHSPAYEIPLWQAKGGHGGADPAMLHALFSPDAVNGDKYMRKADERAGAWSIMVGIAANESMRTNKVVSIKELLPSIPLPDYPDNLNTNSKRENKSE